MGRKERERWGHANGSNSATAGTVVPLMHRREGFCGRSYHRFNRKPCTRGYYYHIGALVHTEGPVSVRACLYWHIRTHGCL